MRRSSIVIEPLQLDRIFTRLECQQIVSAVGRNEFGEAGLVGGVHAGNTRRSRILWLDEDGADAWIFRRMLDAIIRANRKHFAFALEEFAEKPQIACYEAQPGGFFDWHIDVGDGAVAARRKLTTIVQLSDSASYDGGNLETNADGHVRAASRQIGSGLVMPSFILHRVTPVRQGQRFSLVLWAHGPPFA
jgi:PKHD-type hydroxylase